MGIREDLRPINQTARRVDTLTRGCATRTRSASFFSISTEIAATSELIVLYLIRSTMVRGRP